ncbi:MAG: hypothetical protein MI824_02040, partial [Hyphomicrobiales bacterium]|nr:hypothetical protein [Hyphomicrobiales bacterium]
MDKLADECGGWEFPTASHALKTCSLIDFDKFQVVPGIVKGTWFLSVWGEKSTISMKVSLNPVHYVDQPEYWEIEVVGCVCGIVLPATGPFAECIEITNFLGKKGIEVVGATKAERWELPA